MPWVVDLLGPSSSSTSSPFPFSAGPSSTSRTVKLVYSEKCFHEDGGREAIFEEVDASDEEVRSVIYFLFFTIFLIFSLFLPTIPHF